jgi:3D (Asp-Asp-Asp) domain-containing protein
VPLLRLAFIIVVLGSLSACSSSRAGSSPSHPDGGNALDGASPVDAGADTGGDDSATGPDAPAVDAPDDVSPVEAGPPSSLEVTFYGWEDNSPPGDSISFPQSSGYPTVHDAAGGTGTYADPVTFATDQAEFAPGTILYVPYIQKYVVMEDDCVQCDTDWASGTYHIDIWMNSDGTEDPNALTQCADAWTRPSAPIQINPPANLTVDTTLLFDPSTNTCQTPPP